MDFHFEGFDSGDSLVQISKQIFHQAEFLALVNNPAGGIAKHLDLRGDQVVGEIKTLLEPRRRTGTLQNSFRKERDVVQGVIAVNVGSDYPVAAYLEFGTNPHPISGNPLLASYPDNPNPLRNPQRFVNHPGNAPLPYLQRALENVFI